MQALKTRTYWPLVISGASGAGKGTAVLMLLQKYPQLFELSISLTTRGPRSTELHGREYYFVAGEEFKKDVDNSMFAEHCIVHDNMYGTHRSKLQEIIDRQKICILDIDVQGGKKIRDSINANFIWLDVPSMAILQERLRKRCTDSQETIARRIKNAQKEIEAAHECTFYHFISNDVWENTQKEILEYLRRCYPEAGI